jgi:hypothetical protein
MGNRAKFKLPGLTDIAGNPGVRSRHPPAAGTGRQFPLLRCTCAIDRPQVLESPAGQLASSHVATRSS